MPQAGRSLFRCTRIADVPQTAGLAWNFQAVLQRWLQRWLQRCPRCNQTAAAQSTHPLGLARLVRASPTSTEYSDLFRHRSSILCHPTKHNSRFISELLFDREIGMVRQSCVGIYWRSAWRRFEILHLNVSSVYSSFVAMPANSIHLAWVPHHHNGYNSGGKVSPCHAKSSQVFATESLISPSGSSLQQSWQRHF